MPGVRQRDRPIETVRLLRYRFDTVEQVPRHFHVVPGGVLLFYPCLLALVPGEPLLLDVSFIASDQHCPLRGKVVGKETSGQYAGAWLAFPAAGLVNSLRSAAATPKRQQRRFPADVVVNVERDQGMPVVSRLLDVGAGGARLARGAISALPGDRVQLSLFSRDTGGPVVRATVAWIHGSDIGVEFQKPSPSERAAIALLVGEAREKLVDAYEATHPTFCRCLDGERAAEPALPQLTHRQTGSH